MMSRQRLIALIICTLITCFIGVIISYGTISFSDVNGHRGKFGFVKQIDQQVDIKHKLTREFVDQRLKPLGSFGSIQSNVHNITVCEKVPTAEKLNCLPMKELTKSACESVGCCWDHTNAFFSTEGADSIIPPCYFPPNHVGYQICDVRYEEDGFDATFERVNSSGLPKDVPKLKLLARYIGLNKLRIKIADFNASRYEVPLPLTLDTSRINYKLLNYDISLSKDGMLEVIRKVPKTIVFSVSISKLLFADQLLQLTSDLSSHYIYGLADHMSPFLKSVNWTKYTFLNSDTIPAMNKNLYSSFPFYLVMEDQGSSHGVFLFNSNAMDVILQPKPAVTFRTIGGVLDFFIFMGPSPTNVVQQFTELNGYPAMPPYWSLGFHLCRLGYVTLNKTMDVWRRTMEAGIPYDTQWNDIDYMNLYNDFTYDKSNFKFLPDFVKKLHSLGMHYVLITDPAISNAETPGSYPPFDDGLEMNIFVKNSSGEILTTKVWNKISSVFPDFTNPISMDYWHKQMSTFHSQIPFDGVWLDMNEPTNFLNGSFHGCPSNSSLESPVYVPGGDPLCTKTICMTAKHNISSHYNVHNIYGILQTKATYSALSKIRKKRPFIVTRAGFPGIGCYSAMWNGDVLSEWEHMRASIPSLLGFSISGVPMSGSDICGFNDNTTVELCARWSALGAFYPFSRNHNSDENIEQDPVSLGKTVIQAAKVSLTIRYFLLPYLYTLFYFSHIRGDTVARPLFFEFPEDIKSFKIDRQFLWGPALLITPVLEQGVSEVTGYFPPGLWYDFYSRERFRSNGENFSQNVPIFKVGLAIRAGYILPCQIPNVTTTASRKNEFIIIATLCDADKASGELFWDDGDSLDVVKTGYYNFIKFSVDGNKFISRVIHQGYATVMKVVELQVSGVMNSPLRVLVNGKLSVFDYNPKYKLLLVKEMSLTLLKSNVVVWE